MKIGLMTDTHWGYFSSDIQRIIKNKQTLYRLEEEVLDHVIEHFRNNGVDVVVHIGDIVDKPTAEQVLLAEKYLSKLSSHFPVVVIRGNHDPRNDSIFWYNLKSIHNIPVYLADSQHVIKEIKEISGAYAVPYSNTVSRELLNKKLKDLLEEQDNICCVFLHYTPDFNLGVEDYAVVEQEVLKEYEKRGIFMFFGHIHSDHIFTPHIRIVGSLLRRSRSEASDVVAVFDTDRQHYERIDISDIRKKYYYFMDEDKIEENAQLIEQIEHNPQLKHLGKSSYLAMSFEDGFEQYLLDQGIEADYATKLKDELFHLMDEIKEA